MNNKEIRPVDNIKPKEESIIPDNTYKREMTEYRAELKLSMFSGNDVEEWVEKARDCIEDIKDEHRASFICQHLQGRAYEEMKIQSDTVKHNAEKLLEALEIFFGKIETDQHITRRLMNIIQSSREDIGTYTYALAKMARKMKKSNDMMVRDCFRRKCAKLR